MSDTWNAQDDHTDPNPTVPVETTFGTSTPVGGLRPEHGSWVEEHGPLFFVDAIAAVALLYVGLRALGV